MDKAQRFAEMIGYNTSLAEVVLGYLNEAEHRPGIAKCYLQDILRVDLNRFRCGVDSKIDIWDLVLDSEVELVLY